MKFKYIGKEHTVVKHEGEKYRVEENETLDLKCDETFEKFLLANKFIVVKMEDKTKKEVKKETKETKKTK